MADHFGRIAMLYTTTRGIRGIRFQVQLPRYSLIGWQGHQKHYVSAYASFFVGDPKWNSIVEAGMMFTPLGDGPGSGAWSTVLNPGLGLGATLRHGKWVKDGQRSLRTPEQGPKQVTTFELMLTEPERGTFKVDGVPFNDGAFMPAAPPTKEENTLARFEKGVNARIAIGYNDEGKTNVVLRDFGITVTRLYSRDARTGAFDWVLPGPLTRRDETRNARFGVGEITLDYGAAPVAPLNWLGSWPNFGPEPPKPSWMI